MASDSAKNWPELIDSRFSSEGWVNSSTVSIFTFSSQGWIYDKYRDDPVFPAKTRTILDGREVHINNDTLPGILGCVDNTYVCDPLLGLCWNYPPSPFSNLSYFTGNSTRRVMPGYAHVDLSPHNHSGVNAEATGTWESIELAGESEAELANILLTNALLDSNLGLMFMERTVLDIGLSCSNSKVFQVPLDQWKDEARIWYETSLARIQVNVLGIVRGSSEVNVDIPQRLRGLCRMGKFRSVGWRNVSVWGLLGLLSFAAAVSIASVKTEAEELWLVVGIRFFQRMVWWIIRKVRKLPWRRTWRFLVEYTYRCGYHVRGLVFAFQGRQY